MTLPAITSSEVRASDQFMDMISNVHLPTPLYSPPDKGNKRSRKRILADIFFTF